MDDSLFETVLANDHHVLFHVLPDRNIIRTVLGREDMNIFSQPKAFPEIILKDNYLRTCTNIWLQYLFACVLSTVFLQIKVKWHTTNRVYGDAGGRGGGGGGGGARGVGRHGGRGRRVVTGSRTARPSTVLAWPRRASSQNVDDGVLDQRRKDEHQTDDHPDVDCLDVRDTRQWRPSTTTHRGRCQHGQQTDGHSCRTRVDVDPERHPRQDDDEHWRHVDLDQEVADVAPQNELNLQTRIRT